MDETKNLAEIEGLRQPGEGSGRSSDEAKNLADTEGSPFTSSQVEAIFFAALNERTAAERADYLARACGDNAKLRIARGTASESPSASGGFPGPARGGAASGRATRLGGRQRRPSRDHRPLPGDPAARARAASGGSTSPATTSSTDRWRSRCPTPSGSPAPRTSRRTWPRPGSSPSSTTPTSSRSTTSAGPTTGSATSSRSTSRGATWPSGCGRAG